MRAGGKQRTRDGEQGFTLVELLVGLTIIALATGVAGLAFSARQPKESAADFAVQLQQLARLAHHDAITSGSARTILFDLEDRTVVYDRRGEIRDLPEGMELTLLAGLELIAEEGKVPVVFYGEGGSTGTKITLKDRNGEIARLETSWLTGQTKVLPDEED